MLQWAIQFCRQNWPAVRHAPLAFFVLLAIGMCVAAVATWLVTDWFYGERMAIQAERLAQKDDIISKIQRELDGVPPEHIVEEVTALKTKIARLESRNGVIIGSTTTDNGDGTFTILKTIVITAWSPPNSVIVYARSKGIVSIEPGGQTMFHGEANIAADLMATRIKNPNGEYTITVVSSSEDVELYFAFE